MLERISSGMLTSQCCGKVYSLLSEEGEFLFFDAVVRPFQSLKTIGWSLDDRLSELRRETGYLSTDIANRVAIDHRQLIVPLQ